MTLFKVLRSDEVVQPEVETDFFVPLKIRFRPSIGKRMSRILVEPVPTKLLDIKIDEITGKLFSIALVLSGDDAHHIAGTILDRLGSPRADGTPALRFSTESLEQPSEPGVGVFVSRNKFCVKKFDDGIWIEFEGSHDVSQPYSAGGFLWATDSMGGLCGLGVMYGDDSTRTSPS